MLDKSDYDALLGLQVEANTKDVIKQLNFMFGGLDKTQYSNGRIEVGSTAGECKFFKLSQFHKVAAYVTERTHSGEKTYIHAGLIKPDGEKVQRASQGLHGTHSKGADVLCWPVVWGEADHKDLDYNRELTGEERNDARLAAFEAAAPWGFIYATGSVPTLRLQGLMRLDVPASPNDKAFWDVLKSISVNGKLDVGANNSSQLVRLAGSVSFSGGVQKAVEVGEVQRIDEVVRVLTFKPAIKHSLDKLHTQLANEGKLIEASAKGALASAKGLEDLMSKVKRPDDSNDLDASAVVNYVKKQVAKACELESGGDTNRRSAILGAAKAIGGLLWTGHFEAEDIISDDEDFSLVEAYHANGGAADNGENGIAKGIIDAMATGAAKPLLSVGTASTAGEAFGAVDDDDDDESSKAVQKTVTALFSPVSLSGPFDLATSMPRRYVYRHWFALGYLTMIIAPGAAGKSALLRAIAICIAAGVDYLSGDRAKLIRPRPILIVNGEDDIKDMLKGVEAFLREHEATPKERASVYSNLKLFSSVGADPSGKRSFGLASYDEKRAVKITTLERNAIESFIDEHGIEVALFDPLASLHTTSESNEDLDVIARMFAGIATRKEIAVGLAHHTTKSSASAGKVDSLDARGGGAAINAARISIVINGVSADDCEVANVPPRFAHRYMSVKLGSKANLVLGGGPALILEKASHDAGNARDGYAADSIVVLKHHGEADPTAAFGDDVEDGGEAQGKTTAQLEADAEAMLRLCMDHDGLPDFLADYLNREAATCDQRDAYSVQSNVLRSRLAFALDHFANRSKVPNNANKAARDKRDRQRKSQLEVALKTLSEKRGAIRLTGEGGKPSTISLI
ncbi:AAA family ATPase [Tardiphaga sp. vice304]|uniref:AAA family ATPase n=1 Tax=Tardiphaga sp. vice304 TaxID=2592817 RepID=UPI00143DF2C1|nr:AAA family ATPase [Tardiphaga sp. vice304]